MLCIYEDKMLFKTEGAENLKEIRWHNQHCVVQAQILNVCRSESFFLDINSVY